MKFTRFCVIVEDKATFDVLTVRKPFLLQCSGAASGDFSERVAALLHSSSTQDDC